MPDDTDTDTQKKIWREYFSHIFKFLAKNMQSFKRTIRKSWNAFKNEILSLKQSSPKNMKRLQNLLVSYNFL